MGDPYFGWFLCAISAQFVKASELYLFVHENEVFVTLFLVGVQCMHFSHFFIPF